MTPSARQRHEATRSSKTPRQEDPAAALSYAVRLLGYRDRSEAELRERLALKGFAEDILEAAIVRLKESGFIDDGRLAGALVRHATDVRHLGMRGVKASLFKRGLPREIVEEALSEVAEDPSKAAVLIRKRMKSMSGLSPQVLRRRLWALLSRRGFSPETIREALTLSGVKEEG